MLQLALKELREKNNISQYKLAKILGVSQSTVAMWESGKNKPEYANLNKIAEVFDVSLDLLTGNASTEPITSDSMQPERVGVMVPVYGSVAAGIPLAAIQEVIDYEEITKEMARKGEYFALRIKGDSMEPRVRDGDTVIVLRQSSVENGETAIVLVNGDDATCKKVCFHATGLSLISSNSKYAPMFFTAKEVEELPITILGKVIELRGKM